MWVKESGLPVFVCRCIYLPTYEARRGPGHVGSCERARGLDFDVGTALISCLPM